MKRNEPNNSRPESENRFKKENPNREKYGNEVFRNSNGSLRVQEVEERISGIEDEIEENGGCTDHGYQR